MVNGDSLSTPLPHDHVDLQPGSIVLRAAIFENWVDKKTQLFKYQAFMLAPKDGDFLSVFEKDLCHPREIETIGGFVEPIYGIAEGYCQDITSIRAAHSGLYLRTCRTQAEQSSCDAHASIYGLARKPAPPTPIDEHTISTARSLLKVFRTLSEAEKRPS